jgi:hypothetical protein
MLFARISSIYLWLSQRFFDFIAENLILNIGASCVCLLTYSRLYYFQNVTYLKVITLFCNPRLNDAIYNRPYTND